MSAQAVVITQNLAGIHATARDTGRTQKVRDGFKAKKLSAIESREFALESRNIFHMTASEFVAQFDVEAR